MGQARHHCEQAFEAYVRRRRAPLVVVNEARKSLLPAKLSGGPGSDAGGAGQAGELKSFDYILYGADLNLLVEIKGRRLPGPGPQSLQNWVTAADIASLRRWEALFGPGFCAALVFLYWSDRPPLAQAGPGEARPEEIFEHAGRWYLLRAIACADYQRHMGPRSERWDTVHLPAATFDRLSRPLLGAVAPAPLRRRPITTSRIPPIAGAA